MFFCRRHAHFFVNEILYENDIIVFLRTSGCWTKKPKKWLQFGLNMLFLRALKIHKRWDGLPFNLCNRQIHQFAKTMLLAENNMECQ